MALSQQHDIKTLIPSLLQSTATAYNTLGRGIFALGQLKKVSELLEVVICNLKKEHGKYDDLVKVLSALAVQYKKLDVETKCHVRTVKEQAEMNTKITEEAKQQLLRRNNISKYFVEIEKTVKESQASSEELHKKYDIVIHKVKDCCSQAKAGYERNEHKADLVQKGTSVGLLGGMCAGGAFVATQVVPKALCVFGVPGAILGGVMSVIGGSAVGGLVGGLPFATAEALFRKYAEKFKILDETLSKIDQILLMNFEVLSEICRLLEKLKKATQSLSEASEVQPASQDKADRCSKVNTLTTSNCTDGSNVCYKHERDTSTPSEVDDTNIDFLIQIRFDEFKQACEELEKNCDYLLDDMPLMRAMGLLSLDETSNEKTTEAKKLN